MPISTIEDVANAAKVSKSTVSRVLNGDYTYIREETRLRVQQAISDLNYRPSGVARSLTSKCTQTIAILVTDVSNPFYSDVIHGVEDIAIEQKYNVFLGNINYDQERGKALIQSLIDRRVDGVIIMSSTTSDDWLDELTRNHIPTVVLDWDIQTPKTDISMISVDFKIGIWKAVDHLWDLGHRRYAHISGPLRLQTSRDRRDAFLEALSTRGIPPRDVLILESNLRIEGGREATEILLSLPDRPTAVFTANDLMAYGVLSTFHKHGLNVPQDISVVGLDNIWLAAETFPPLTTVSLPSCEIGALAVRTLFDLLNHPDGQAVHGRYSVQTDLVIRSSTSIPPG